MPAPTLNERQMRLMAQVWQCTKTDPVIDFPKLAKIGGFSTPKSAQTQWTKIKALLKAAASEGNSQPPKVKASASQNATPSPESPKSASPETSSKKRSSPYGPITSPPKRPKRNVKKPKIYGTPSESSAEDNEEAAEEEHRDGQCRGSPEWD